MSREEVLARIRRSLDARRIADPGRRAAAEQRLKEPASHPIPARARQSRAALELLFESELRRQSAHVVTIEGALRVPGAVATYLKEHGAPLKIRMGQDPVLAKLPWASVPGLEIATGPAVPEEPAAVSRVLAGIAETGTLVLVSGASNPTSLALMPETHVAILPVESIVGTLEEAFGCVRTAFSDGALPRSINLVSGPSRTGDIGGRLVLGAHGPRRLGVFVVRKIA